jgi:hypothetical protein
VKKSSHQKEYYLTVKPINYPIVLMRDITQIEKENGYEKVRMEKKLL